MTFFLHACEDPFLKLCAHLDPPEWHAAVQWAAWAGHGRGCPGHADAGAACDAAGADGKGATRPPHVCSWEHLHTKIKSTYAHLKLHTCTAVWRIMDPQIHAHTHISPWQSARYISSLSCGTVVLPGAVSFLSHNACASLEHWPTSW